MSERLLRFAGDDAEVDRFRLAAVERVGLEAIGELCRRRPDARHRLPSIFSLAEPLAHPPLLDRKNRLEQDGPVAYRGWRSHWAVAGPVFGRSLRKDHSATLVRSDAPQSTAAAYQHSDREVTRTRAVLDVAIREPKKQDRRAVNTLHMDDLVRCPSNQPEHVVTAQGLAHRRDGRSSEVVLEVTVRELEHNRLGRQGIPPSSPEVPASRRRKPAPANPSLDELLDQRCPQLGEAGGWIIERTQDCLAILNRESDDHLLGLQRDDEHLRRIFESAAAQEFGELEHVSIAHGDAGEHHGREGAPSPWSTNARKTMKGVRAERRRPLVAGPVYGVPTSPHPRGRDWVTGSALLSEVTEL